LCLLSWAASFLLIDLIAKPSFKENQPIKPIDRALIMVALEEYK
jgi:hypothetical protein